MSFFRITITITNVFIYWLNILIFVIELIVFWIDAGACISSIELINLNILSSLLNWINIYLRFALPIRELSIRSILSLIWSRFLILALKLCIEMQIFVITIVKGDSRIDIACQRMLILSITHKFGRSYYTALRASKISAIIGLKRC